MAMSGVADSATFTLPPLELRRRPGAGGRAQYHGGRPAAGTPPGEGRDACIDAWVPAAADRGHRFSLSDWLIAALSREIGGLVWSLDADFAEMERLSFVGRFER